MPVRTGRIKVERDGLRGSVPQRIRHGRGFVHTPPAVRPKKVIGGSGPAGDLAYRCVGWARLQLQHLRQRCPGIIQTVANGGNAVPDVDEVNFFAHDDGKVCLGCSSITARSMATTTTTTGWVGLSARAASGRCALAPAEPALGALGLVAEPPEASPKISGRGPSWPSFSFRRRPYPARPGNSARPKPSVLGNRPECVTKPGPFHAQRSWVGVGGVFW